MSVLGRLDLYISFVLHCRSVFKRLMSAERQALHWQQEPATKQVLQRVSPAVLTSLSGAVLSFHFFSFFFWLLWENDVQVADSAVI